HGPVINDIPLPPTHAFLLAVSQRPGNRVYFSAGLAKASAEMRPDKTACSSDQKLAARQLRGKFLEAIDGNVGHQNYLLPKEMPLEVTHVVAIGRSHA